MIRLLFLLIIAAIVLSLAFFKFNRISTAKKMTVVGGGLTAAAAGILLQNGFAWYMPILALFGVSLAAALVYMKLVEREELEKKRLAEERKERRHSEVKPQAAKADSVNVRETIQERQTATEREAIKEPRKIQIRETIKVPDVEEMPEKTYGMQSVQPVGKER